MRALILLALLSLPGAALAAPQESDRMRIEDILVQLDASSNVDIGYCADHYGDFGAQYGAIIASPVVATFLRATRYFQLESSPPDEIDREPSQQRCLDSMHKVKALFARHARYLEGLAERIDAAGG